MNGDLRELIPVDQAITMLGFTRAMFNEQVRAGRLHTVNYGGATYVSMTALLSYAALLQSEAESAEAEW